MGQGEDTALAGPTWATPSRQIDQQPIDVAAFPPRHIGLPACIPGGSRERLMSVDEVCEFLGVSRYFVYDQVRVGVLPCARIARQLKFRPADIDALVDASIIKPGDSLRELEPVKNRRR